MAKATAKAITPVLRRGRAQQEITQHTGPVVSRAEALEKGLIRYFLGTPCWHGHISQRQTSNKECVTCAVHRGRKRVLSDEYKAGRKAYRQANKERINAYRRATALELGPKRNAGVKRWYDSEKGKAWWRAYAETKRAIVRNRRAKQRASEGQHTPEDIADILRLQRGKCAYCRTDIRGGYHVDHIVAIANGGSNDRRNIQLLCPPCNMHKNAADPIAHAQRIGLLI
jgi:5-methylcytosine-specific restriction endonuclease McrA